MGVIVTPAIVLRYSDYRDHDRMLTLLTPNYGTIDVISRGCKRPKSSLLSGSELFVSGEYTIYAGNERNTLTSFVLDDNFYPLRLDNYILTCATYMASLCAVSVPVGESANDIYALLLKGLYYLSYDHDCNPLSTTTAFLLHLADKLGYRPRLTTCVHCLTKLNLDGSAAFDITAGGLCCPECTSISTYRISHNEIVWISQSLRYGFSSQHDKSAERLFDILRRYIESRLDATIKVSKLLP